MPRNPAEKPKVQALSLPESSDFHGGAWKVAYADFVTAMMAFFLLLWLLSTADEATLDGIAEYFEPTIGVKDSLGIGFEGGTAVKEEQGIRRQESAPVGIVVGQVKQGPIPETPDQEVLIESEEEAKLFTKAEEAIQKAFESDPTLRDLADNIVVEQSPEGMKVQVADSDKYAMFDPDSSELSRFGKMVLSKMLPIIEAMPNFISISGHTDVAPHSKATSQYTNWELSTDRANSARRFMQKAGLSPERTKKIVGFAASDLLVPEQPKDARNRRVTIILLRGAFMDLPDWSVPAARGLLTIPGSESKNSVDELLDRVEERRKTKERLRDKPVDTKLPSFYQNDSNTGVTE